MLEPHAGRPLAERPGLARLEGRRVMVLAEPRGAIAVIEQDAPDGGDSLADDAVVAGESGRLLRDDAEAGRMVIAAGDQRGAGRRAERCRVEIGVAQAVGGDAIERRGRDHAAEGRGGAEADVVGHDEQDVRRTFGRHDAHRPIRLRLRGVELDRAAEGLRRRRQLVAGDVDRRRGRARRAVDPADEIGEFLSRPAGRSGGLRTCRLRLRAEHERRSAKQAEQRRLGCGEKELPPVHLDPPPAALNAA